MPDIFLFTLVKTNSTSNAEVTVSVFVVEFIHYNLVVNQLSPSLTLTLIYIPQTKKSQLLRNDCWVIHKIKKHQRFRLMLFKRAESPHVHAYGETHT
jgi:hypothetical protein